jgi:hypothetical protein
MMSPPAREGDYRPQCKNNLKQIALALFNYREEYDVLPPAFTVDANGKPLHSWRTLILPYLDQKPLYDTIDLSKPWNDPANAEACATKIDAFVCPLADAPPGSTTYHALVGPDCCFHPTQPRSLQEITDGLSNTLSVVDVSLAEAVPWMSPEDSAHRFLLGFSEKNGLPHEGGIYAALGDGTVRFLSSQLPAATRRALATIAGGEDIAGNF